MYIPQNWGSNTRGDSKKKAEPARTVAASEFVPKKPEPFFVPAKREAEQPPEPARKRTRKSRKQDVKTESVREAEPVNENHDVYATVRDCITRDMHTTMREAPIDLDTILSRIPYRDMLENLFGNTDHVPEDVPVITRAYEEQFMRECIAEHEKPCVMGENCECRFIDLNMRFIGTEFLLPGDTTSEQPQMCVLCSRKTTQHIFYDMLHKGMSFRGVIQRYGNICDKPGEYARQCMLICPPSSNVHSMPLPIVAHQRNRYVVRIHNGKKHIHQQRVYYEDFQ